MMNDFPCDTELHRRAWCAQRGPSGAAVCWCCTSTSALPSNALESLVRGIKSLCTQRADIIVEGHGARGRQQGNTLIKIENVQAAFVSAVRSVKV
jgi:hypothetical protein